MLWGHECCGVTETAGPPQRLRSLCVSPRVRRSPLPEQEGLPGASVHSVGPPTLTGPCSPAKGVLWHATERSRGAGGPGVLRCWACLGGRGTPGSSPQTATPHTVPTCLQGTGVGPQEDQVSASKDGFQGPFQKGPPVLKVKYVGLPGLSIKQLTQCLPNEVSSIAFYVFSLFYLLVVFHFLISSSIFNFSSLKKIF